MPRDLWEHSFGGRCALGLGYSSVCPSSSSLFTVSIGFADSTNTGILLASIVEIELPTVSVYDLSDFSYGFSNFLVLVLGFFQLVSHRRNRYVFYFHCSTNSILLLF